MPLSRLMSLQHLREGRGRTVVWAASAVFLAATVVAVAIIQRSHTSTSQLAFHLDDYMLPASRNRVVGGMRKPTVAPKSLSSLLVMVAFHWRVQNLAQLELVLTTVAGYPVSSEIIVFTNQPGSLTAFRDSRSEGLYYEILPPLDTDPFLLTWAHRSYLTYHLNTSSHSAVLYLEDDIVVPWSALLDWARDDALLAPLNLQRGFYRVETDVATGQLAMTDVMSPLRLEGYPHVIHLNETYCDPSQICDFLQLPVSYTAMWIATREKVLGYVTDSRWTQSKQGPWEVREMAASGVQFLDDPLSVAAEKLHGLQHTFTSAAVIPYHAGNASLAGSAAIYHTSNRFCAEKMVTNKSCTVLAADVLKG